MEVKFLSNLFYKDELEESLYFDIKNVHTNYDNEIIRVAGTEREQDWTFYIFEDGMFSQFIRWNTLEHTSHMITNKGEILSFLSANGLIKQKSCLKDFNL